MKKFLKTFFVLLAFFILFMAIWVGANLWPREVEPPLWTVKDLAISEQEKPGQNGYSPLVQMREEKYDDLRLIRDAKEKAFDEDLNILWELKFSPTSEDVHLFWSKVKERQSKLSDLLQDNQKAIQIIQEFIEYPQLLDKDDPTTIGSLTAPWLDLLDLHPIATLYVVERASQGDLEKAYDIWLKMFQQDLSHLNSARSLISHMVALSKVDQVLSLLSQLRIYPPSITIQEKIQKSLKGFDAETINFRRSVVVEYLLHLAAADRLTSRKKTDLWLRITFNRALFMRELNDLFHPLEAFIKDSKAITEQRIQEFQKELNDKTYKGLFWWFINPGGKSLLRLLATNPRYLAESQFEKDKIKKMREELLAFPQFSPLAEARSVETKNHPVSYQGLERKNAHPLWRYLDPLLNIPWEEWMILMVVFSVFVGILLILSFSIRRGGRARRAGNEKTLKFPLFSGLIFWNVFTALFCFIYFINYHETVDTFQAVVIYGLIIFPLILLSLFAIRVGQKPSRRPLSIFRVFLIFSLFLLAGSAWMIYHRSQNKLFIDAVRSGDAQMVTKFLQKGYDPNIRRDKGGETLLRMAIRKNKLKTVQLLIEAGADVNYASRSGRTALFWAIYYGREKMARLLLANGAEVRTGKYDPPLSELAKERTPEIYQLILEKEKRAK